MRFPITTVFLLFIFAVKAQDTVVIEATIVDKTTAAPIPFVNVGFVDKGIGTVTNELGEFSLEFKFKHLTETDVLRISSMGYAPQELSIREINIFFTSEKRIYLSPSETALPAVVITSVRRAYEKLGSETYSRNSLGYWHDMDALGGELATRIHINQSKTRLHDFKFNILENASDSLLVRINVYDCNRNMPGKNLLSENIYHLIRKKEGVDTISLKPYNIVVDDDVVIGIELVEVYGDDLYLAISATPFGGTAYLRERSMDYWDVRWGFGLGFGLLSSYPERVSSSQ